MGPNLSFEIFTGWQTGNCELMIEAAILPFKELGRIIHADLTWGVRGGLREEHKVTGSLGHIFT